MAFPFRDSVLNIAPQAFREKSKNKKIVLLYPWNNYKNLFLTYFLDEAKEGLLYYRIPSTETSLSAWLTGLVREFEDVLGKFGTRLRDVLPNNDPAQMGKALAADLALLKLDPITLFIDELDRLPMDDEFTKFINALVKSLPEKVQIAFSSRLLTYQPWIDILQRGDAVVLGTEYRRNDLIFTVEDTPRPQLEVYGLGRGHVLVNGQAITTWDGALPRNLFFFFVDHPLVTRDEIFQSFWPEMNVKEATNVFHVTKRKITERISIKVADGGNYELTQYNAGFYLPSEKIVRHYDVADFQDAVEKSISADGQREAEHYLTRAIDLYKAPFLSTVDQGWVIRRRDELKALYAQALIGMGRVWRARQDHHRSLGFFLRALKEVPEREDIHRQVMFIYYQLEMYDDAGRQYERLEKMLNDKLHIEPSRESRELWDQIQSKLNA